MQVKGENMMEYVRINRLRGKIADYTDVSTEDDLIRINFRDASAQIEMTKEDLELFSNELSEAIKTFVDQDEEMNDNPGEQENEQNNESGE